MIVKPSRHTGDGLECINFHRIHSRFELCVVVGNL